MACLGLGSSQCRDAAALGRRRWRGIAWHLNQVGERDEPVRLLRVELNQHLRATRTVSSATHAPRRERRCTCIRTLGGGARSSPALHANRRVGTPCAGGIARRGAAAALLAVQSRRRDAREASATASGSARPTPLDEAWALRRWSTCAARANHRARALIRPRRGAKLESEPTPVCHARFESPRKQRAQETLG